MLLKFFITCELDGVKKLTMDNSAVNKYDELKRKVYLVIIPILFATNIFYWLVSPNINRFMEVTIPPTCLFLIALWFCFYKKIYIYYLETFSVIFASVYHLIRINTMTSELAFDHLNVYMFWSPIYYILVFMVLERKKAIYLSSFIFFMIVLTTSPIIETIRARDIMIQYYLSTIVYILVLFYFKKVVTAYIESDILVKSAYFDYLTNIGNRRSIDHWLEEELQSAENTNNSFSIVYFDIDHFKKINDVYGHDVGDQVLKEMAVLVASELQPHDRFGRWGGEEFIIVSNGRDLEEALAFANVLRQTIQKHSFQHVEHVTSSFGVATYQPNDVAKTILKRADQALYFAKNNGRNIVMSSDITFIESNTPVLEKVR